MFLDEQDLMWAAFNAIVTPESIKIKRLAYDRYNEDRLQRAKVGVCEDSRPMWVRMLALSLQRGNAEYWGYAVFRTSYGDEGGWKQLHKQVEQDAAEMMKVVRAESIADRFQLCWTEDKALIGADQTTLQKRFADVARNLPRGIRHDYFLSIGGISGNASCTSATLFLYAATDAESDQAQPATMNINQLISPTYGAIIQGRNALLVF